MKLKTQWLLLASFSILPYIVLVIAGAWWMFSTGWWLWWVIGTALVTLAGWPLFNLLKRRTPMPAPRGTGPSPEWSPAGRAAWEKVEGIARRTEDEDIPLDDPQAVLAVAREIVDTVARSFHARSSEPILEVPVPHLLQIVELVARDLRETFSANIPGSHILTIHDLQRLQRLVRVAPTLYRLYRVLTLVVNPATALARELSGMAQERMLNASAEETKRWMVQYAVRKIGYYSIELYSGNLLLRGVEFDPYVTSGSQKAIVREQKRTEALESEPLRILVIGQVKAGKSSLINALFGETRAAVDVVPRTRGVEPYLLERDGIHRAIIFDTAGYEDASRTAAALDDAREEIERCDLILLVSSALSAARDADRQLLDQVRKLFRENPDREFPPVVVVLTHIDQVRPFREWNPPYDLARAESLKAKNIREAVEATASDLQVNLDRVIPVCLLPDHPYNVDEGLIPAILTSLSDAKRVKYLRCLREYRDEQYWTQLRQQSANAGRIALKTGWELVKGAVRSLVDPNDKR